MTRLPLLPLLPPASAFYAAGALVLGGLALSLYVDSQRAADRLLALREGSPAAVAIEAFDPTRDTGPTGEVAIRAQVVASLPLQMVFRDRTRYRRTLAYPVLAAQTDDAAAPVLGFLQITEDLPRSEVLDIARIVPPFEQVGALGPIVVLNGELGAPEPVQAAVAAEVQRAGLAMAPRLLAIAPYPHGRVVALAAPRPGAWRGTLAQTGVALLAAGALMSRLHPWLAERRHRAGIAHAGRKRSGVSPEIATSKARSRLTPLAPPPKAPGHRRHGPLTALALRAWQQARRRAIRNPQ